MTTYLNSDNINLGTSFNTPTITSIAYGGGITSLSIQGNQTIIITGTNFTTATYVFVGDMQALAFTVNSDTQITITTPTNFSGSYPVKVVLASGVSKVSTATVEYTAVLTWITPEGLILSTNENQAVSVSLSASGSGTLSYAVTSGLLPAGLTLSSTTGLISGTLGSGEFTADFSFTVTVTDSSGSLDRTFIIRVQSSDDIIWGGVGPNATITVDYTGPLNPPLPISAVATSGTPSSFTVTGLPSGLVYYSSDKTIRGIASGNGTYTVTVSTTTPASAVKTMTFTIVVNKTVGQTAYIIPGTYSWVCPAGVSTICVVCVGGGGGSGSSYGGGGGGGGLAYGNNIGVTPGNSYNVIVGAGGGQDSAGGSTYFNTAAYLQGGGGAKGVAGTGYTGGGGGGAGGYAGAGGAGGIAASSNQAGGAGGTTTGTARTGGGAGGAGGGGRSANTTVAVPAAVPAGGGAAGGTGGYGGGYGGGGTSFYGQGPSGVPAATATATSGNGAWSPNGGSVSRFNIDFYSGSTTDFWYSHAMSSAGGEFGGGGCANVGTGGALRIIWGAGRAFPATLTLDL